jgi:NDP-sugar pyrophosphorylase family protein
LQPITKKGKAQLFMDYVWRSLPMDNEANDVMMGTEFTELWIPIGESQRAMNLLQTLFDQHGRLFRISEKISVNLCRKTGKYREKYGQYLLQR